MDALELLDELEDIIDKGPAVPFTGRCIFERDELLDIIQELKLKLPEDLKQAKWIKEERQRILQEAQAEAADTINEVKKKAASMIDENEITKKALSQGKQIVERATTEKAQIVDSAYNYSDDILETIEKVVLNTMKELEQCVGIVRNDRSRLRDEYEKEMPTLPASDETQQPQ